MDTLDAREHQINLGKAIARQRKLAGLTQAETASKLGIDKSTIYRIENGDIAVAIDRMLALGALFKCSNVDFFWVDEDAFEKHVNDIYDILDKAPTERREVLKSFFVYISEKLRKA